MKKAFFERDKKGFYLVALAIFILGILLVCGLAIDGSNLLLAHIRLQRVVDAGALSAIKLRGTKPNNFVEDATSQLIQDSLSKLGYALVRAPSVQSEARGVDVEALINVPIYIMKILPGVGDTKIVSAKASAGMPPAIIELVLDKSGSMCQPADKLEQLKVGAKAFIDGLDDTGRNYLGVVEFSSSYIVSTESHPVAATTLVAPAPITANFKVTAKAAIDGLVCPSGGQTCISCGLELGLATIKNVESSNNFSMPPKKFLVLFTDGAPNVKNTGSTEPGNSYPASFSQCWKTDNAKDSNNQPVWGLYSSKFWTTTIDPLRNLPLQDPPNNIFRDVPNAELIWEIINAGNHLAIENVETYTISLTSLQWQSGYVTGCNDTGPQSVCPSYLLNVGDPYREPEPDGRLRYNPYRNPRIMYDPQPVYDQGPIHLDPNPYNHFLYGICPDSEPTISNSSAPGTILPSQADPFQLCEKEYRSYMLRRIANDPVAIQGDPYPDPIFPYRPDAPAPNISSSPFCIGNPSAWQCHYWDECTLRVGENFPQGQFFHTPDRDELPRIFQEIMRIIRNKARLLQ